jgi:hypothetical protein
MPDLNDERADRTGPEDAGDLEELIEQIDLAAQGHDKVSMKLIMEAVGKRSFGPLILTAGLILVTPLSGIPGLPSILAVFILLVAVQLLFHWDHFWVPKWILRRTIKVDRLRPALRILSRPARWVDKLLRPRMRFLTHNGGSHLAALVCIVIAVLTPPLELLPFSATMNGVILSALGLSLVTHDGLLALAAYLLTITVLLVAVKVLL